MLSWQLASVALGRGGGHRRASGSRSRPTPLRGRRSPARGRPSSRSRPSARARCRVRAAGFAGRRRGAPSSLRSSPAAAAPALGNDSGKLEVVATTTQIGDFVARGRRATRSTSTRSSSRTPTRTSTSRGPSDVEAAAGAELVFANGDNLDAWIDQVVSGQRQRRRGRRPRRRRPGQAAGRESAAPRRPATTRTGGTTRGTPRRRSSRSRARSPTPMPAQAATFERNAAALPGELQRARPRDRRAACDSVPAGAAQAGHRPRRLRLLREPLRDQVVGAVIPSQTTQAQPSAKDLATWST